MAGTYTVNGDKLTGLTVYSTLPVGTIILYGGSVIPVGFLICNGDAISRTDYADLFSKIGTTYGAGDGSTTFNIPNKTEVGYTVIIKAVDYVSLPQNAIDDEHTTTGNAWSADKIAEYVQNYNKLSDYEEVQASEFGNSEATAYEAEYDGFFIVECLDGSGGKYAYMQIKTVEGTTRRFDVFATSGGKQTSSIPVQKGDKLWYTERSSAIAYSFRYYKNR